MSDTLKFHLSQWFKITVQMFLGVWVWIVGFNHSWTLSSFVMFTAAGCFFGQSLVDFDEWRKLR